MHFSYIGNLFWQIRSNSKYNMSKLLFWYWSSSKWLLFLKKWRSFYDEFFLSDDFLFHKIFHYQCKNNNLSVHFRAVLLISQYIFNKLKCWFKACFHSIFEFNPVKNSNNHFLVSRKDFPRVWEVHRLIGYWFYVICIKLR